MTQAYSVTKRVFDLLREAVTNAGNSVFMDLDAALEREEMPAIVVEMVSDDHEPYASGMGVSNLKFRVVFLARSDDWQSVLSVLRAQAHDLIMHDVPLIQLLSGLRRERMEVQSANADSPFAVMVQNYVGRYNSVTESLSSLTGI